MNDVIASEPAGSPGREVYLRDVWRRSAILSGLLILGVLAMFADLAIGSGTLSFHEVLQGLLHPASVQPSVAVVLWDIRMPVTLTAALAGIGLALAGTLMQTVLENPLAEPFTLGISAAAGFGAALVIVFQTTLLGSLLPSDFLITANAFIFALVTVLLIGLFANRHGVSVEMIVLLGIAVHFVFSALLGIAQYVADSDQLQSLVFWMMGSLTKSSWTKVGINAVIVFVSLPVLLLLSWQISALRGFGAQAAVLGIPVKRLRMVLLLIAALLAASITATIGIVGFVGLVAPHIARMLVGEDQRFSIGVTAACGLLVMTIASIVSKIIIPGVILPIGMVTSLLGVPFFFWLVLGYRRRG